MKQSNLTDDVWTATTSESLPAPAQTTEDAMSTDGPETEQALRERAAAHACDVAAEHFPELPVEAITWETSTRMERSAGKAIYDRASEKITIRLSWDAYREYSWEKFARTVRHELIHAYQYHEYGEADHGPTFRRWVKPLETDRHCEQYAEPKYWIVCEACDVRDPRYRRSKVVKQPDRYSCGRCEGPLCIENALSRRISRPCRDAKSYRTYRCFLGGADWSAIDLAQHQAAFVFDQLDVGNGDEILLHIDDTFVPKTGDAI